ncbi:MAG: rhomboid family intramembrane serine protease [Ginsengibacter sp.]
MAFNNFKPSQTTTPVVLNLIIINALVYLAQRVFDSSYGLTEKLVLFSYNTGLFEPYQLVTHMFAHSPNSIFHILFNMYALWLFGSVLEKTWGGKKFLIFYLLCGLAAGVSQMFLADGAALGASGAVMGLLAGFAYTYPNVQFYIFPLPVPIKAKWLAVIYALIDIFGQFSGIGGNIAHFAHLGGLVMGLILVMIWGKGNNKNYY